MTIYGIASSPGIAMAPALVNRRKSAEDMSSSAGEATDQKAALLAYDQAVESAVAELTRLGAGSGQSLTGEEQDIIASQIEWLHDPEIRIQVKDRIDGQRLDARRAVGQTIDSLVQLFSQIEDEYLRARASDIRDIGDRLLKHLGQPLVFTDPEPEAKYILIAEDVLPTTLLTLDLSRLAAIVMEEGGKTSHAAIIARSRGIPAVSGCGPLRDRIKTDDLIIVDGREGRIIINPTPDEKKIYQQQQTEWRERNSLLRISAAGAVTTTDGTPIKFMANISNPAELELALELGAEGVGLFRTELLYLQSSALPTEEEQFHIYAQIARRAGAIGVTVRTFDIGGDKPLPYLDLPPEANPFLGYRAIRISLDRHDMFVGQLRAILRASAFGKLRLMFPMVSGLNDWHEVKAIVDDTKEKLLQEGLVFDQNIETGIMVEVPAAAIMADRLAREVDFFSIGSNDLVQYTMAADRMNRQVAAYYDPFHPAVLRLIHETISQGRQAKIPVSLCGELAADPLATQLLIGMGLREFSMEGNSLALVKSVAAKTSIDGAAEIYDRVKAMDHSAGIIQYLKSMMP